MKITLLGGGGIIGRVIARDLVENPRVTQVVLADLDVAAAQAVADGLGSSKVTVERTDVTDTAALSAQLADSGCVINAVQYYFNLAVMEAALASATHYVDLGGLFHTTRKQLELHERFQAAGLTAILGLGSCPGIANVQAAALADRLDTIETLHIYNGATKDRTGDKLNWAYSINTILDEISEPPMIFEDGEFKAVAPVSGEEMFLFKSPIGWEKTHLSLHSEVATLPLVFGDKGLKSCFFKISFFGYSEPALRKLQFLAELGLASRDPITLRDGRQVAPREVVLPVLDRYVKENPVAPDPENPGFKDIATVADGTIDGRAVQLRIDTTAARKPEWGVSGSTLLVAAPPAILAVWLAAGEVEKTGVLPPEVAVDYKRFFAELAERGASTEITTTEML